MISFILVNYNTKELTNQAINSIIKSFNSINNYEIILVDNASTDESKKYFEKLHIKNFKYIYNDKNVGFGTANNIGFQYTKGEYIYILNSDTVLHTKNIDNIVKQKFDKYQDVGAIATKVIYGNGLPQPNVQKFSNLGSTFLRLLKIGQLVRNNKILLSFLNFLPFKPKIIKSYLENFNYERAEKFIDWASGCSLVFRRNVYEKLNGFDENFFMYSEDEEICYRARKIGYKILYTPDILVTHFEGKSNGSKKINPFLLKEKIKSEFYYYKKHFPSKYKKLKMIYGATTLIGYPFSNRLRLIRKYYKKLEL